MAARQTVGVSEGDRPRRLRVADTGGLVLAPGQQYAGPRRGTSAERQDSSALRPGGAICEDAVSLVQQVDPSEEWALAPGGRDYPCRQGMRVPAWK